MALTAYQTAVNALIQAPTSPVALVPTATINLYINTARNQLAADAECIRTQGTLALSNGIQGYTFGNITLPSGVGFNEVITVRSALISGKNLEVRPWEWFEAYYQGNGSSGTPTLMAQQGQGVFGSLSFSPTPNAAFTVTMDVCVLPIPLVDDSTTEAIPDLWRDAVPFYAAWLAMMQLQRQADAEMMMQRYKMLSMRGRQLATPTELPENLPGGRGATMVAGRTTLSGMSQGPKQ